MPKNDAVTIDIIVPVIRILLILITLSLWIPLRLLFINVYTQKLNAQSPLKASLILRSALYGKHSARIPDTK
ncbi:hypothetical protein D3C81_1269090 [compost metagenome]